MGTSRASHKIGLGTAQFGLDYGIANQRGRASREVLRAILEDAARAGVRVLDTAPGYGGCEELLGELIPMHAAFDLVTKTPVGAAAEGPADAARAVKKGLRESLRRLRVESVYGLLEHRPDRLLGEHGDAVFGAMAEMREQGLTRRIGASVYSQAQLDAICERHEIDLLQVPVSVFDQRMLEGGRLRALQQAGVEVHARSVLLQGVAGMSPEALPSFLAGMRSPLQDLIDFADRHHVSAVAAAIALVESLSEVDVVLCGVEDQAQLGEILEVAHAKRGVDAMIRDGFGKLAVHDPALIDPSRWPEPR